MFYFTSYNDCLMLLTYRSIILCVAMIMNLILYEINYKVHLVITFMLGDEHMISLGMLMHVKYIYTLCSLLRLHSIIFASYLLL
jgi:hypothetical protein